MGTSIGEQFTGMLSQTRQTLRRYEELGPVGAFGATLIRDLIARAETAQAELDAVAMLRTYKEMESVE